MPKIKVIKSTVFIPEKLNKELKKMAVNSRVSKTVLIRNILQKVMDQNHKRKCKG